MTDDPMADVYYIDGGPARFVTFLRARLDADEQDARDFVTTHSARVLAEVNIWRDAVSRYVRAEQDSDAPAVSALLGVLVAKAEIYREHPDYAAAVNW